MITARPCCSGNEIMTLADCIFAELNVTYVDLVDASNVSVPVLIGLFVIKHCLRFDISFAVLPLSGSHTDDFSLLRFTFFL